MKKRIAQISCMASIALITGVVNAADTEEPSFSFESLFSSDRSAAPLLSDRSAAPLLSYSASNFNADPSQCNAILEYAAKDVNTSINRKDRELYIYKQACDYRYENSSGSRKSSIGINVFSYFGLSASGDSAHNTTVINQWCEENQLEYSGMDFDFSHQETVNETSIRAFESCIALTNKNFEVSPTLEDNQSRFRLRNLTHAPVTLQGVSVVTTDSSDGANTPSDELDVKCSVDTDVQIDISADSSTRVVVQPNNSISVTCKRENVNILRDGEYISVFPAYSIVMGTTLGDFGMSFEESSVTKLTDIRADAIEARIDELATKMYPSEVEYGVTYTNDFNRNVVVSYSANSSSARYSNYVSKCSLTLFVDDTVALINSSSVASNGVCEASIPAAVIPMDSTWRLTFNQHGMNDVGSHYVWYDDALADDIIGTIYR